MSESIMRRQFLDVFLKEWELRGGDDGATRAIERNHGNGDFDAPLNAGELRLFAQGDNELVGLLYKRLDDGWIVVPTSEFTVPATEQEILIGKRVYQLWNSFTASDEFAGQSWLVDTIPQSDMKDLCEALLHVMVGDPIRADLNECMGLPITSIEDPRLEYERTFAASLQYVDLAEIANSGIFEFPLRFWRKAIAETIPYRLAAATDSGSSFMLLLDGTDEEDFRSTCVECSLQNVFMSINPGDKPFALLFKPNTLPEEWKLDVDIPVVARNRETLEIVGDGVLEAESGEIIIHTRKDIAEPIAKPSQLVLGISRRNA